MTDDKAVNKTPVEEAKEVLERIEKANADSRDLLKKHEDAAANAILAGKSVLAKQETPKPETASEYKNRVMGYKRL